MNQGAEVSYPEGGHASCLAVEDASFWFRHRNDCISTLVNSFGSTGRFVDIGGGNGFVAKRLADDGLDVVLVEPGDEGARHARELRGIEQVIHGTLQLAHPQLSDVTAAGAFDVVEHIERDREFVDQIADALPVGGMFYSTVPAHTWLWSVADDEAGHFRRYTTRSYGQLLSKRFDVLYMSYFFRPLVLPIALQRSLPYRLGRRKATSPSEVAREHGASGSLSARIMTGLLSPEVSAIQARRTLHLGSSIIAAARKIR